MPNMSSIGNQTTESNLQKMTNNVDSPNFKLPSESPEIGDIYEYEVTHIETNKVVTQWNGTEWLLLKTETVIENDS